MPDAAAVTDLTETPLFAPTANGDQPEVVEAGPPATAEELARQHAFELQERIIEDYRTLQQLWVRMAGDLYRMQNGRLWRYLGYDGFEEWIDQYPFSRSWVYELTSVYRAFVIDRAVEPERLARIDASKMREILPAVRRGKVDLDAALADAETLSVLDLRDRYKELRRPVGTSEEATTHYDAAAEPVMVTCPTCDSRVEESRIHLPVA